MAETAQTPNWGTRIVRWATSYEDGKLMRAIFFGLLMGTIGVLIVDFFELSNITEQSTSQPGDAPILPAVERPEIDPDNPAFAPQTRVTSDPKTLGTPMLISLEPGGILKLEGTIVQGSAEALRTELESRGEYIKSVALNSPGGVVSQALEMGALIREKGYVTRLQAGAFCASSCPLIFASGTKRLAHQDAAIGVHQIYTSGTSNASTAPAATQERSQAVSDAQTTTAAITRYLKEMGADPALWINALETPPDRLYYFTPKELLDFKLATKILK